ncbi:MAG TPA: hypothetical protein VML96_08590, partial [Egibacteraceae bacterium]|nr:hypothetical protein [Egibacteraceae bacterium]
SPSHCCTNPCHPLAAGRTLPSAPDLGHSVFEAKLGGRAMWGFCSQCGRWFYEGQVGQVPHCPVCNSPASKTREDWGETA